MLWDRKIRLGKATLVMIYSQLSNFNYRKFILWIRKCTINWSSIIFVLNVLYVRLLVYLNITFLGYISINNRVTLLDLRDEAFYAFNYSCVKRRRMVRLSKYMYISICVYCFEFFTGFLLFNLIKSTYTMCPVNIVHRRVD